MEAGLEHGRLQGCRKGKLFGRCIHGITMAKYGGIQRLMKYSVHRLVVGPFQENTWYVANDERQQGVIIDPGEDSERITGLIEETGTTPVAIINTHGHLDHIGAVHALQEAYGLPFYLHPEDQFLIQEYREHAAMFGVPMQGLPEVTHTLQEGDLNLGGLQWQCFHTPGHTPGGISFLLDGELFAGDTLFAGSIGRTDLPGGDTEVLLQSIHTKLMILDDDTVVHAGHGPDTSIGSERHSNPFLRS